MLTSVAERKTWHDLAMGKQRRLQDQYRFAGARPLATVRGLFGDPVARIVVLVRRQKNGLWRVWALAPQLLRSTTSTGAGSVVRQPPHLPGRGSAPGGVLELRNGEPRAVGVAGS